MFKPSTRQRLAGEVQQMSVMREQHDLGLGTKIAGDGKQGSRSLIIDGHQQVVQDDRHRLAYFQGEMSLQGRRSCS